MQQLQVTVQHRADVPGGLPAVWMSEPLPSGEKGKRVTLWLAEGMPVDVADRFRAMCVRDCLPDAEMDTFTVTTTAREVREVRLAV